MFFELGQGLALGRVPNMTVPLSNDQKLRSRSQLHYLKENDLILEALKGLFVVK